MDINCTTEEIPNITDEIELKVLIIALIEALKHQKSKFDKGEVLKLVKIRLKRISLENIFDKIFDIFFFYKDSFIRTKALILAK